MPQHPAWTDAYLGLPYEPGRGECAQRAAAIWRERFGFEVEVQPANGDMHRAQRLIEEHLARPGWERVETPREGDAVLMRKGPLVCHVGVWVDPGHVLHCTRAAGTVLTPVEALPGQGFEVAGLYRRAPQAGARMAPEERMAA